MQPHDEELEDGFQFSEAEDKAFKDLREDFNKSKKSKTEIDKLMTEWNDIYEGKQTKKIAPNRSKLVMKEMAKQIEWQKPNMTEPFTSTSNPIRMSGPNQSRVRIMQKYANMHFAGAFDRHDFMDQLTDVMLREGTVWVKTGWFNQEEKITREYPSVTMERILAIGEEPDEIEQNEDGTFKVKFHDIRSKKNEATADIQRNENVFPDPSARTRKEMRHIMVRRYETISSLRASGNYEESVLRRLEVEHKENQATDSALGSQRNKDDSYYGYDTAYSKAQRSSKKIAIIEYWGEYDLDDDGISEQVIAEWAERGEVNLRIEKNEMPSKEIPFQCAVYSARPFSIWGNGLGFFIGDSQEIKSGLMRGVLDNMSNANNGQTFALRGAMDYVNFKRWKNGDRHVILNKAPKDAIQAGNFNNLPPAVFNVLSMVEGEIEKLSGTQAGGPALSNSQTAKDDTGDQQMTMAQQRMASSVRNISNLLSKVIKEWIVMADIFLDNEQIEAMFTDSEEQDILTFRDAGQCNVKLKVGTEVTRGIQTQQLNMLLQQSKTLGENMPPEMLNKLVAEMYELFDMYEDAEALREFKPEPSPQQQMMSQMQMQEQVLKNQKLMAEISAIGTKEQVDTMNAQSKALDAQMGALYKTAQSNEKDAKAQAHKVETALKPVQQMTEIEKAKPRSAST
jgi:hypothetical protein